MKAVDVKSLKLMPPAKHLCQVCAVDHEPDQPHNAQSFYYQMKFNIDNGRRVTWEDAMQHCSPQVKTAWNNQLDQLEAEGTEVKNRWHSAESKAAWEATKS